ncbi:MAG: DUF1573 domain-containing protein [Sphingobacteriales bacterium]|nr:MAG: DUF1573 domain-containing protein [Sphingobacteriales bacterium]TAF78266.1 MAG: DUF1573 domain-containing protein [Sphingobacteriales bacterium]
MKNILTIVFFIIASAISVSMNYQTDSALKFDEVIYDFGKIKQHKPVKHIFRFKNVSKVPAIIRNITTACGCTVPVYSNKPVMANEYGNIEITYDAKALLLFNKTIIVMLSTEKTPLILNIKGEVVPES